MRKIILLWIILGAAYINIEIFWRGYTHVSMFIVGGLCGVLIGLINQSSRFYNMRVITQSAIGAVIVLCVELLAGIVINIWLGLDVWDYTGLPGNILGQICLQYGLLWLLLMPFAIWLEDTARWCIYLWDRELGKRRYKTPITPPYTLTRIYADFFTGK